MSNAKKKFNLVEDGGDLDSNFDEDETPKFKGKDFVSAKATTSKTGTGRPSKETLTTAHIVDIGQRQAFLSLNAYDRHVKLINQYHLCYSGSTDKLKRDTSKDRTDYDVIRENHRFLWTDANDLSWEQNLAKKYYDRLFKEYCITDLTRFKENKVAMRWRTETEVTNGKGQFSCASRNCSESEKLRTWEVDFAYFENGGKKKALVKVRLCPECSYKLNYHHKKKEIKKKEDKKDKKKKKKKKRKRRHSESESDSESEDKKDKKLENGKEESSNIWKAPVEIEQERTREEEFSEYLEDLFL